MKSVINSCIVAFAMFSKIPMPRADWSRENMKYMFCFFPAVGAVVGALFCGMAYLCKMVGFQREFTAALLILVQVLVTGGIHVDGLLDTADAMSSWQERERRLEILKDSRAGAFAVITAGVYFVVLFGAYVQLCTDPKAVMVMSMAFVLSRCFSGIGVLTIPKAKADGTVAEFSRNSSERTVLIVLVVILAAVFAALLYLSPVYGCCALAVGILVFLYYRHMALKYFGGTTGDLSGFFLCVCEAVTALALAALSGIGLF